MLCVTTFFSPKQLTIKFLRGDEVEWVQVYPRYNLNDGKVGDVFEVKHMVRD